MGESEGISRGHRSRVGDIGQNFKSYKIICFISFNFNKLIKFKFKSPTIDALPLNNPRCTCRLRKLAVRNQADGKSVAKREINAPSFVKESSTLSGPISLESSSFYPSWQGCKSRLRWKSMPTSFSRKSELPAVDFSAFTLIDCYLWTSPEKLNQPDRS